MTGLVDHRSTNAASAVQVLAQVNVGRLPVAGQRRVAQVACQDFAADFAVRLTRHRDGKLEISPRDRPQPNDMYVLVAGLSLFTYKVAGWVVPGPVIAGGRRSSHWGFPNGADNGRPPAWWVRKCDLNTDIERLKGALAEE